MLRHGVYFPNRSLLRLCGAIVLALSAWSGASFAQDAPPPLPAGEDAEGELDAPPPPPPDPEPSQGAPPLADDRADEGEDKEEDEDDASCLSNPLVWVVGGLVVVVGAVVGVICGVPLCTSCGYLSFLGCSYGAIGSVLGCAACSQGGLNVALAFGGVSLVALSGVAGAALIASDAPRLDSATTLAGAGLIGAAAVGATALVGLGLHLVLSEPDEEHVETRSSPAGPQEQPLEAPAAPGVAVSY